MLLINFTPAATPYRASHAIFVREGATRAYDEGGALPAVLRSRPLSLRAFDAAGLHPHYARRGCYAGRIERA